VRIDLLSRNLRAARKAALMTQEDVAHKARMQVAVYSRIERGEVDPRLSSLTRIANAIDTPLRELVDGVDQS
jgi:transcriptional regulator with XRE-family HTH domain